MTASTLINDLKARKFKPAYLFHGEEAYYIDLFSDYIEKNLLSDAEKGFNQTVFYGRDVDMMTVLNSAKRYPMMSEFQLVLIKEAQDMKWGKDTDDKKSQDPLLAYLERPLASTILVFCYKHDKFDKRRKSYKAFEKAGVAFESASIYDNKVPGWVEDYVREKAYRMNPRASAMIAEYLGTDLSKISNELDKLMLNIPKGNEITAEDVQDNIGISKEYNVFELQAALAKRNVIKASQIITYFASNPKSNPIQLIIGALNTWFTRILKFHYITDKSQQNVAKVLSVNPYFVKDFEMAAKNYELGKVFDIISLLREYDLKTKGVDSTGNTDSGELMKELVYKIIH
ncbi:DNA polymerase III subunit delta [Arcticibacter eurypsychrophilus]|uniref:DNA polymerase III subunit delta n=1 Tax=Arcticibacter eurypsychrophilus TaxID=1434752 RepID=UPI00084DD2A8|nr:DNA polymerase III subunit delta [Arcticibacter eurypsychrophilus]